MIKLILRVIVGYAYLLLKKVEAFSQEAKNISPQKKMMRLGRKSISSYDEEYYRFVEFKGGVYSNSYGGLTGLSNYTKHPEYLICKVCKKPLAEKVYYWEIYQGHFVAHFQGVCYDCCPTERHIRELLNVKCNRQLSLEGY